MDHESESEARRLADQAAKVGELELKVQLLVNDAGMDGDLQNQLSAKKAVLVSAKFALEVSGTTLKAQSQSVES